MRNHLSSEEITFLLGTAPEQEAVCEVAQAKERKRTTSLRIMESSLALFPQKASGFAILLFCVSLLPMLGLGAFSA